MLLFMDRRDGLAITLREHRVNGIDFPLPKEGCRILVEADEPVNRRGPSHRHVDLGDAASLCIEVDVGIERLHTEQGLNSLLRVPCHIRIYKTGASSAAREQQNTAFGMPCCSSRTAAMVWRSLCGNIE